VDKICSCQSERREGVSAGGRMVSKKMKCVGGARDGKNMRRVGGMTENRNLLTDGGGQEVEV